MKKSKLIYTAIAAALLAGAISASAQSDSSNVPQLRGNPVVTLSKQERETPVVNNITNVTQQLISTGMSGSYRVSSGWNGGGPGTWGAQSVASCGGGTAVSGGGECTDFASSWTRLQSSFPVGSNAWTAVCVAPADNGGAVYTRAFVVCVP